VHARAGVVNGWTEPTGMVVSVDLVQELDGIEPDRFYRATLKFANGVAIGCHHDHLSAESAAECGLKAWGQWST